MKRTVFPVLVFLACAASLSTAYAERYSAHKDEIALINQVTPLLDSTLRKKDVARLSGLLDTPQEAAAALAVCILYKQKPAKYRDAVFEKFAVRDYTRRGKGKYAIITREQMLASVKDMEARHPEVRDSRVRLLLAFLDFRDANEWFMLNGRKISAARFFRSAFLAAAFKGTDIDALQLANAIDQAAQGKR